VFGVGRRWTAYRLLDPHAVTVELAISGGARVAETTVRVLVPVLGTREIGARAVRPEDGADRLLPARGGEGLAPRERLDRLHAGHEPKLLQEHLRRLLEVHGVEMQALDAQLLVVQDPATHVRHELDARRTHALVVVLVRLELVQPRLWDDGLREHRRFFEAVPGLNRRDAGHYGHRDPRGADGFRPADEHVDVVEHLGEDEGAADVDLLFQVLHLPFAFLRG
jgi:hypothetical protein